jgi:hypothetical protein
MALRPSLSCKEAMPLGCAVLALTATGAVAPQAPAFGRPIRNQATPWESAAFI